MDDTDLQRLETDFFAEEKSAEVIAALQRSCSLRRSKTVQDAEAERLTEQFHSLQQSVTLCSTALSQETTKHAQLLDALKRYQQTAVAGTAYQRMYSDVTAIVSQFS